MKKYLTGLAAIVLAISASAFTKATESTEGQYYLNGSTIEPITTDGTCVDGENFCRYNLIEGQPDDGNPVHYEGEGPAFKQWVPALN